jgi:redox-sensitive bicupin YhaK (pirin superfamily)
MPQQEEGRMRGFQLWINLPAKEKMKAAGYRDITPNEIPVLELALGGRIKIISGEIQFNQQQLRGPIYGLTTEPLYLDVSLAPSASIQLPVDARLNAMIYVFEGDADIAETALTTHCAVFLSEGESVKITANDKGVRFLLLAGLPLHEPIVQYGPFVINTVTEIKQAIHDYQTGQLTAV